MKLSSFLTDNGISLVDFSESVKCSISMLSHINTGRRRPSPDLAWRIEQQTGGLVSRDEMLYPSLYEHIKNLESQIKPEFDQVLSRRIDNATLIIEG
jgi:transcriptional regulator with XRE-family HTH domain